VRKKLNCEKLTEADEDEPKIMQKTHMVIWSGPGNLKIIAVVR
jgi:hypothetical protein